MNRRAFLLGLAAVSAAIPFARFFSAEAFAQGRTVSRIVVDTGPLEARGARGRLRQRCVSYRRGRIQVA